MPSAVYQEACDEGWFSSWLREGEVTIRVIWRVEFSGLGHQLWEVEEEKRYHSLNAKNSQGENIRWNLTGTARLLLASHWGNGRSYPLFLPEMQWPSTELQVGCQSSAKDGAGSNRADRGHAHPLPVRIFQRLMQSCASALSSSTVLYI